MKQTNIRERRKFDETFKREAVQNWLGSGKPCYAVGSGSATVLVAAVGAVTAECNGSESKTCEHGSESK